MRLSKISEEFQNFVIWNSKIVNRIWWIKWNCRYFVPSAFEFTISSGLARSKGSLIIFYRAASTSGAAESQRSRTRGPFSNSREEFQSVPDGFTSVSEIRNTIGPRAAAQEERGKKGLGKKERNRRRRRRRRRRRKKRRQRRPCRKSLMFMHGLRNEPSRRIMHL